MATATIKFTESPAIIPDGSCDQDTVTYLGSVTFSAAADTYLTGGLLPLAGFDLKSLGPYADRTPLVVYVESLAGTGFSYVWVQSTGKLKILASAAGSNTTGQGEAATATALSGLTGGGLNVFTDVVVFEARFPRR